MFFFPSVFIYRDIYINNFFKNHENKQMNGSFVALLSVQLNISPSGVKQRKTPWSVSQERQNSFYTHTHTRRKLVHPAWSVRFFNFNNMALSD